MPEDLPWLDLDSRILLAIYRAGRVRAGVRELADELDYSSGRVSERLRALLEKGYLREVERGGDRYYEVTPRGRRRIYPFIIPGYLILFVAVLGLVITAAGLLEQLTGVAPAP